MKQETNKIKYFLYARKSSESEDRQVASIESQIDEMKKIIEREELKVAETITEAHSAKIPGKRPLFERMLNDIKSDKVQGIIVWNPNRLSRNSVDTGQLIYMFDLGKLVEVVTPSQVFRNTPNDKFLFSLLCSQAKLENDNRGIDVKRGLYKRVRMGVYPAPAPLGYMNDKYAERGNKTILPDPERFDVVRKMFDLMLTGTHTVLQILRIVNEEWKFKTKQGTKLGRSSIYSLFSRPFYYGMFEYPIGSGNWIRGIHKPIVTEEEYDKIQILLGRKGKPRPKSHIFEFTGMMRCGECNGMITAEEKIKRQKNGNIHRYIYYHCTKRKTPNCSQGVIEVGELKTQIRETLEELKIMPLEFHEYAMKWFREQNEKESTSRNAVLSTQQRAYTLCVKKLDNLIDMRAAGEINESEFAQKKSVLTKDKMRLEELLADTGERINQWLQTADDMFTFVRDALVKFNTGTIEVKRQILSALGQNLILKDKKLDIDLEKSLFPVKMIAKEVKAIHKRLEPAKKPINKAKLELAYARNPRLQGLRESNPRQRFWRPLFYH